MRLRERTPVSVTKYRAILRGLLAFSSLPSNCSSSTFDRLVQFRSGTLPSATHWGLSSLPVFRALDKQTPETDRQAGRHVLKCPPL